jgi:hypothetical protein
MDSVVHCHMFDAPSVFLGHAWADGEGKLSSRRHRADSGGETVLNVRRRSLDRLHASMIKQKKKLASLVGLFGCRHLCGLQLLVSAAVQHGGRVGDNCSYLPTPEIPSPIKSA